MPVAGSHHLPGLQEGLARQHGGHDPVFIRSVTAISVQHRACHWRQTASSSSVPMSRVPLQLPCVSIDCKLYINVACISRFLLCTAMLAVADTQLNIIQVLFRRSCLWTQTEWSTCASVCMSCGACQHRLQSLYTSFTPR